jgi:hypothetical protein
MIKNEMELELIKIEVADVDIDDETWENPGGSVFVKVNGKNVEVIIHACGEFDVDCDDDVTDEEMDAVFDFVQSNAEVEKAFPADEFP